MKRLMVGNIIENIGETVKLMGWVDTKRDHGKITFIDLRDISGTVQCVGVGKMGELGTEYVLEIVGVVKKRPDNMVNEDLPLGTVEIEVEEYTVLNECTELPIPIDTDGRDINEESRLKYRYLDLRRARLSKNLKLRSDLNHALRKSHAYTIDQRRCQGFYCAI